MRLEQALERFLLQLDADGRSRHTRDQYQRHVRALGRWLAATGRSDELATIDADTLARFLISPAARNVANGRAKKSASVNALRTSLRVVFGWLHAEGSVAPNPARLIRRAICGSPAPRPVSARDQQRLLDVLRVAPEPAAVRDHLLVHLLLATGVRLSSALAIERADVDLALGVLRLRCAKGDREQLVFLGRAIRDRLAPYIAERGNGLLFPGRSGAPLCARTVQARLAAWAKRAGIERAVTPHQLRHSFATELYERTGNVLLVQRALGHRSVATTMVYATCDERQLRAAMGA